MIDLEESKAFRQSVRQRHAKLFVNQVEKKATDDQLEQQQPVRQHTRWKQFMGHVDDLEKAKEESNENIFGPAFIPSESTVRNDYSQRYIDTNQLEYSGNAVKNPEKHSRFQEYPKLFKLIESKLSLLDQISVPPTYLQTDLLGSIGPKPSFVRKDGLTTSEDMNTFHLSSLLPIKYDVVIIDPPLESYEWESIPSSGKESKRVWTWEQIAALPIPTIMAKESFVFFWVGSGASDGLERGREVLNKWGFRRCEDIVWIRTNPMEKPKLQIASSSALNKTAEHCLMGIRGTVRRSTDVGFVHCNIDTDVIIWPGETSGSTIPIIDTRSKPPEMMDLIENFCLGTRRLELFGRNRNLRRGWLTIGLEVGPDQPGWEDANTGNNACSAMKDNDQSSLLSHIPIAYDKLQYDSAFHVDRAGCTLAERSNLVPFNEEIDDLRPKSPRSSAQERNANRQRPDQIGGGLATIAYPLPPTNFMYAGPIQTGMENLTMTGFVPPQPYIPTPNVSVATTNATGNPGGAGLSGLGAGGRSVVSVPSGSELLSGAQASVMLGQQGQRPINSNAGPIGLSKRGRR